VSALRARGFVPVAGARYLMLYRHEPGPVSRALSRERAIPLARLGFRALNTLVGPVGNKLTVQTVRV